jgi:hypothetical protein
LCRTPIFFRDWHLSSYHENTCNSTTSDGPLRSADSIGYSFSDANVIAYGHHIPNSGNNPQTATNCRTNSETKAGTHAGTNTSASTGTGYRTWRRWQPSSIHTYPPGIS